ncbi:MAG TPA: LpqB family beta-propeller domain-containing protein [Propionibacteriaceae bacterium]|nr:LpqB family beta-propeller domain-containing protein [Propionibacteriaceae bacterium]
MSGRSRLSIPLAMAVLMLAMLTGCVQVPTAGPIERVEGQQEACQSCVNVEVAPPAAGDDQRQIVEAYLRATSNYQPNYSVARQFLTKAAAERWSPEDGVSIYRGSPAVSDETVRLEGRLVGSLAPDRTYTAQDKQLSVDFHLVREDGEWRIDKPPDGLMVAEYSFNRFYQAFQVYFIGNGSSLAPERIYLPTLRSPANVASALMTALLAGPSEWLAPAVESAIPADTSLSVDSVTITNSIAEVALSEAVLTLPDPRRSLMAAQIVFTLKQASGVKGVLITVNQQRYRVPESDPTSMVIPVDAFSRDIDPVPFVSGDQLYVVNKGTVQLVTATSDTPTVSAIDGDLGQPRLGVNSLAVSMNGTDLALVTRGRTELRRAQASTGDVTMLISGLSDLLRPQFTRYGEVWALGRQNGKQKMWMFTVNQKNDDTSIPVHAPVLGQAEVTAFRISPAGSRIALVRKTRTGSELGLARIIRGDKGITVDEWRQIDLTQTGGTQVTQIADLAWVDANDLLLLGAASKDAALAPIRVTADASQISAEGGEPANWNARELTVLYRPQTTIVVGSEGLTWRNDGSQWLPFVNGVDTIAYPG